MLKAACFDEFHSLLRHSTDAKYAHICWVWGWFGELFCA